MKWLDIVKSNPTYALQLAGVRVLSLQANIVYATNAYAKTTRITSNSNEKKNLLRLLNLFTLYLNETSLLLEKVSEDKHNQLLQSFQKSGLLQTSNTT